MRTFGTAVATLATAFLLGGLAWPHLAGRLLQILVALLAMSWVGARVYRARLPLPVATDTFSPFDAQRTQVALPRLPEPVDRLARQLRGADDPGSAARFAIPARTCRVLTEEATRRLAEHRGLDLHDASDRTRIRTMVSDPTWRVISHWSDPRRRVVDAEAVPLTHLDGILDDLEGL